MIATAGCLCKLLWIKVSAKYQTFTFTFIFIFTFTYWVVKEVNKYTSIEHY